jgi:hypothetical protein
MEPVTAGAALGPGPGMEALGLTAPTNQPTTQLSGLLASIAQSTGNANLGALAAKAAANGQ